NRAKKADMQESEGFKHVWRISVFCNDTRQNEDGRRMGDALDISLMEYFEEYNQEKTNKLNGFELIAEDPFDSESRFMGTAHLTTEELYLSGKGAAEAILERCNSFLENGEVKQITD